MRKPNVIEAARGALRTAMERDDRVVVLGEDVGAGGPFGLTRGLEEEFGRARVRNTPISEAAVMGVGVGLALAGRRPFIDLMFNDFLTLASDQLFNHAAKIHFMSGGRYPVPLTVWTTAGGLTRWGAQHSQRLDGWLVQVPGLKVLAPSSPAAAAASVTAALADPDPVVIVADRMTLYGRAELPGDEAVLPWAPRLVANGDAATVVAVGRLVAVCLQAVERAGVEADVVDLQRLAPLDVSLVVESVRRTGRLLVVHDEPRSGAMSAAIVAAVVERGLPAGARVRRVTAADTPVPAAATLEDAYAVTPEGIAAALAALIAGGA